MAKKPMRGAATKPKKRQQRTAVMPRAAGGVAAPSAPPAASGLARPAAPSAIQAARRAQARPSSRAAAALPTDYDYVATDLRRLGVMAATSVVVLGVLSFLLR